LTLSGPGLDSQSLARRFTAAGFGLAISKEAGRLFSGFILFARVIPPRRPVPSGTAEGAESSYYAHFGLTPSAVSTGPL